MAIGGKSFTLYSTPFYFWLPILQISRTLYPYDPLPPLQALRLLRLANELEGKVVALKREALQHVTIALAGTDTSGLFQLLTMFFGTGEEGEDPFNFLDGAPLIKRPLPLTSESSDDEDEGETASTSSKPTTSTATPAPRVPRAKKQKYDDLCELTEAIIMFPQQKSLHETGIPDNMLPARDKVHRTPQGGSLYLCRHPKCAERPYSGDLPGYGSHFRRVHLGICIGCPYCPERRYWNSTGWIKHMKEKHAEVPWYGSQLVSERDQAEALLQALKDDPTAHIAEKSQERVDASLADLEDPTAASEEVSQEYEGKPQLSAPSLDDFRRFMTHTPGELRDYIYASGPQLDVRYRKRDPTPTLLACSFISADLPPEQEEEEEEVEDEEDSSTQPPASKKPKLE